MVAVFLASRNWMRMILKLHVVLVETYIGIHEYMMGQEHVLAQSAKGKGE